MKAASKLGLVLVALFIALQAEARMSLVKVASPLQNPELIQIVEKSVAAYFDFKNENYKGNLTGKLRNPTVVVIAQEGSKTLALQVHTEAIFISYYLDSEDIYEEVTTTCLTLLIATEAGSYYADNTSCEFNPRREYEVPQADDYYEEEEKYYDQSPSDYFKNKSVPLRDDVPKK